MRSCRRLTAAALLLLAGSLAVSASDPVTADPAAIDPAATERSRQILLRSGVLDLGAEGPLTPLAAGLRLGPGEAGSEVVLVKFPGPVTAEQRRALEAAVERVYTYLPHDTYLVRLAGGAAAPAETAPDLGASWGASWSGPWQPGYKLSPAIAAAREAGSPLAARHEPTQIVLIQLFPDADLAAVLDEIAALGVPGVVGQGRGTSFSRIRLLLTGSEIARFREPLARLPEVFWIDTEARRVLLNDTTIWVGQSGTGGGGATPVFDNGIFGEGQIVGVLDTGIDADMCYFRDPALGLPPVNACNGGTVVDLAQRKVIAVDFLWGNECAGGIGSNEWDTHDHGTHVAGTALGDNFANPLTHDPSDGMAPGAKLVMQDCGFSVDNCADCPGIGCPVVDLNPVFQQAYDQGARLHTNSWGDAENDPAKGRYTAGSQDADEFMWNHKDFLLLFAAGNDGPGTNTVGSPSTAKNVVSVGATLRGTSAESMASFSSCGPTDDGRIKPDVTVPGSSIVSANADNNTGTNNCNTRSLSGTSMASPGAAGFSALIRQYYMDGFHPSGAAVPADAITPSAALVKATLVHSGREMTSSPAIPGACQGWGRVLLDDALHFAGDTRGLFVEDDATGFAAGSSGETRTFQIEVTSSAEPLKVTLTWTDFPSTPAASVNLVNDLDLEVAGPGGTFLGNVFSGGVSAPGGTADRLNSVEQVLLPNPALGTWVVTVRSFTVPQGPQPFALVASGALGTPGGPCTLPPDFGGLTSATDQQVSSCGISLAWNAAASRCPESPNVTHTVYRSTTPGFMPGPANQLVTCLTGTGFTDTAVDFGTTYHYVVRAEDSGTGGPGPCNGGNQDANTVEASTTPTGGRATLHAADFEAGAAGWAHSAAASTCTTGAWLVGNPDGVVNGGVTTQPEDDHTPAPGVNALFTQPNTGGAGTDDVDGGVCTALSPAIDASGFAAAEVSVWYTHGQRDPGDDPAGDFFRLDLSNDGGATFPTSLVAEGDVASNAVWTEATATVSSPGQIVLRVQASDGAGPGDLVEGGLDDVLIEATAACTPAP